MTIAYPGETAALLSAISYSIAIIFFRISGFKISAVPFNAFKTSVGFLFFLITLGILSGFNLPDFSSQEWLRICLSGFIGVTIGDLLFLAALNQIGAGAQAIVSCLYAPGVIFIAYLMFGEVLTPMGFLGGGLVIVAVLITTREKRLDGISRRNWIIGISLGAVAECIMGYAILMIRDLFRAEENLMAIITVRFFVGSVVMCIWGLLPKYRAATLGAFRPSAVWKYTIPSAFFGPYLATIFWFWGFKYTLAGKAAIFNQLSTIFIIILATLVLKERFTLIRAIAVSLAFIGAMIVGLS